ncbi:LysR substrate-binding domain-containing protein [Streptomyces sp. NPDC055681]
MLDVRRLRILQHLATYGTVAATADVLQLTAPAISQQLAVLEREAGVPVVEKHGRTLRLTAAGELLVAHAEIVLGDLAAAESDLAALRGGEHGVLRVASFASAARRLMPAVFARLGTEESRSHSLSLHLVEQEPDLALEALRKQEVDLALVHGYTVLPRDFPAGCEPSPLMEDPVLLALAPARATALGLAEGEAADLSRLADEPWLTPGPETSCYEMVQRATGAAGFVPGIRVRSSDFSVLTSLAAAGAGVALVPRLALPEAHAPLSLHPLMQPVTRTVYTASRTGTARRPGLRHLLDVLKETAAASLTAPA